jgi:DNA-directed RNA polymerase subunit omega
MIEKLKSDMLIDKVGGRFMLAALIQKRLVELLQGARPLVEDAQNKTMLEIVVQEILEDKIILEGEAVGDVTQDQDKS